MEHIVINRAIYDAQSVTGIPQMINATMIQIVQDVESLKEIKSENYLPSIFNGSQL